MKYAGFWRRFLAIVIDSIILLIPSVILSMFIRHGEMTGLVLGLLYRPFFEASPVMGTPGKIFLGMQVTTEAGGRLSVGQAFMRYFLSIVSGLFLFLGYFFNLFTAKRQTFHDLMVGAVVIRQDVSVDQPWFDIWLTQFKSVVGMGVAASSSAGFGSTHEVKSQSRSETLETLEQLHKLYQQGALSEDEYKTKKEELLKTL